MTLIPDPSTGREAQPTDDEHVAHSVGHADRLEQHNRPTGDASGQFADKREADRHSGGDTGEAAG
ncbi:MAG: hypothetical protein U0Q22_08895 [Acidimicrobiales bacterium]